MHLNRVSSTTLCSAFVLVASTVSYGGECCEVKEHQAFTPDTADEDDQFGFALSISGFRLVVGAPGTTLQAVPPITAGMAYVYDLNDELWVADESITAPDAESGDRFGEAVGISGDRIVVGAPFDDDLGGSSGSAYIFKPQPGDWQEEDKLTASDGAGNDKFGFAVAISGSVAVIGAPDAVIGGLLRAGAAYVFRNNGSGVWNQEAKLIAPSPGQFGRFGRAIAIDGNTIIVGEPRDIIETTGQGKAHFYVYSGSAWSHQDTVTGPTSGVDDYFGFSVGVQGDAAVVGAPVLGVGSARVFQRDGTDWSLFQSVSACDGATGDSLGHSVAISGDLIVVGAVSNTNFGFQSGSAYVFKEVDGDYVELAKIFPCDGASGDQFGRAVTVHGGLAAVGAPMKQLSTEDDQGQSYNYAGFSPCECLRDLNGDSQVTGVDLAILLGEWTGSSTYSPCPPLNDADLNGDCHVDGVDLALLLGSWGRCPGDEDCVEAFDDGSSGGGDGELTEDEVAALLGFSDAASFYDWIQTADADDVQAAGLTLLALFGE